MGRKSINSSPKNTHRWHTKRCSTLLIIRKIQMKTTVSTVSPYTSEWPSSRCIQIINAGEGMEKRKSSYTVAGM